MPNAPSMVVIEKTPTESGNEERQRPSAISGDVAEQFLPSDVDAHRDGSKLSLALYGCVIVAPDPAVGECNHPIHDAGNLAFVGDNHDGRSSCGKAGEQFENRSCGVRIEVARRFVREKHGRTVG